MARLTWGDLGERFYETGLDRGVLYAPDQDGVSWPGLVSVSENPSGGQPKPFYLDGLKYVNIASAEEYAATIVAVSNPPEFAPCDGVTSIQNGLFATQQKRVSFGFVYRSMIGNDVDGAMHVYKIHLVYNALAAPSNRNNNTFSNSSNANGHSWDITTLPPSITGYKPTAHLVIDSRYTDPDILSNVEDILYGDDSDPARLPDPDELIDIFSA